MMVRMRLIFLWALCAVTLSSAGAQRLAIGIAPTYDGGGEDLGPVVTEHLTLFTYQLLAEGKTFEPSLLNPGGVYSPLDTSWLTEYVQDRPDLDLLLVSTLKPTVSPDKGSWSLVIGLTLLDAKSGKEGDSWNVSTTIKSKNYFQQRGEAIVGQTISGNSTLALWVPTRGFEKQPLGKATRQLAEAIRDTLPAHIAGFQAKGAALTPISASAPASCAMKTRITYAYKHSAAQSYTIVVDDLDESTTVKDGVGEFKIASGPMLVQFQLSDAPYKLVKQPVYQLSTFHSCDKTTLLVDIGPGGDAHHHWE